MKTKICNKCSLVLDITDFYKRSKKENDYKNTCKSCELKRISKNYSENKEHKNAYHSLYRKQNSLILKNKSKEYRIKNKDKINDYFRNRKKTDTLFKLSCNLRIMVNNACSRNGYSKKSKTQHILGCSFEDFKIHIEAQWESWMNWDNYGKYNGSINFGWDIDHKIPLSSGTNENDIIKLNHYTNLQPLCSYVNRVVKRDG